MPIARILATLALVAACALPLPAFACEFVPYEGEESTLFSLDQGTIIEYNHEAVDGVGTQKGTGHTSCCLAFCEAYGDSMFYNTTIHNDDLIGNTHSLCLIVCYIDCGNSNLLLYFSNFCSHRYTKLCIKIT